MAVIILIPMLYEDSWWLVHIILFTNSLLCYHFYETSQVRQEPSPSSSPTLSLQQISDLEINQNKCNIIVYIVLNDIDTFAFQKQ